MTPDEQVLLRELVVHHGRGDRQRRSVRGGLAGSAGRGCPPPSVQTAEGDSPEPEEAT